MAGALKGITIEIGGNTTKLGQALKSAETQSKSLSKELKGVNTLLKTDPSNLTLLKQKQDLLKESVAATSEKLETLKQTMADIDSGKIEASAEQQRDLQREIASTETKLKSLKSEAAKFGSEAGLAFQAAGAAVSEVGDKVEAAGQKLKGISTAAAVAAGASVAAAEEIHSGYENIITATGATGDTLEDLEQQADDVFSSMNVSMEDTGSAIGEINTRFGLTGDALEDCTRDFMKFADINNVDVTTAVRNVSRYMGDAGIDASEYRSVLDNLTLAAQASGIGVDTLSESLTKYGAPMRALGFETEESIALFSQWEKCGVNTEIAFSGMKKAISNWSSEGKDAREEFKKSLQTIKEAPDIASATTAAIEVFGAKAGPDLADAIQGGRFEYEDFLALLEESDGTVATTFDSTQTEVDGAKIALNNLKLAAAQLGEAILSTLAPIIERLTGAVQQFAEWFGNLDPGVKQAIATIVLVVAALAPLLIGLGTLISTIGTIVSAIGTAISVISTIGAAISAAALWPAVIVAAVVAAISVLYATCEPFRDFVNSVIDAIVGFFTMLGASVTDIVTVQIPTAIGSFLNFWTVDVPNSVSSGVSAVLAWFTALPGNIASAIAWAIDAVASWCSNMLSTAVNGCANVVSGIIGAFTSLPSEMSSIGENIVRGIWDGISNMTDWVIGNIQGFGSDVLDGLKNFLGIHSPSRVMRDQIGKMIPAGIGVGIVANEDAALSPLEELKGKMTTQIDASATLRSVNAGVGSSAKGYNDASVLAAIKELGESVSQIRNMQVVLDTGTLAGAMTDSIDRNLGAKRRRREGSLC